MKKQSANKDLNHHVNELLENTIAPNVLAAFEEGDRFAVARAKLKLPRPQARAVMKTLIEQLAKVGYRCEVKGDWEGGFQGELQLDW